MELRDLIVTPIVILIVITAAYFIRPFCTDEITRRYFMPALVVRIIGALALGFLYQFYYNGGDTFNFHTHGSRHVWEALTDDPEKGVRLFVRDQDQTGLYRYTSKIPFYRDESSYAVIQVASFFDLFTFSSYAATAVLFSLFSFLGMWMFFMTFYKKSPHLHLQLAVASLFIPSVVFWGSGLLKDTITLGCLGLATFYINRIFIDLRFSFSGTVILLTALTGLFIIKIYILLAFIPAAILWIFFQHFLHIRRYFLKILLFPIVIIVTVVLCYFSLIQAGDSNPRYSLGALSKTAQITAYDIRFYTGKEAGSGYYLGELDGTWRSMIELAPQAINVSLFRPYLWEVRNPLMLLSALESLVLLFITLYAIFLLVTSGFKSLGNPAIMFCLLFALTFAFAVGVSTYNFGTLTRYKIPLQPFYCVALILIWDYVKRPRNVSVLDTTE